MPCSSEDHVRETIRKLLIERFEHRAYRRAAITSDRGLGEPRLSIASRPKPVRDMVGEHQAVQNEIVISLITDSERENRATDLLLELISTLHDSDLPADSVVILDCIFRRAWLERDSEHGLSHCHVAFSVTSVMD